jgi:hypothetical protein
MGPGEFTSMVFGCIYVTCFYNSIRLEDVFENVVKGDMLGVHQPYVPPMPHGQMSDLFVDG